MNFEEDLYNLIKQIPEAKFTTYRALAEALGDIRAAKAIRKIILESPKLSSFTTYILSEDEFIKNRFEPENKLFRDFVSDYLLKRLREEQLKLRDKISLKDGFKIPETVAGIDIAYSKAKRAVGACAIFDYNKKKLIKTEIAELELNFPYIPTYLSFRELPVIKILVEKLDLKSTILMIDGNGVLHPYGIGIASHVGVTLDLPTIGVAKSLLCGTLEKTLKFKGDFARVFYEGRQVGYALKSSSESNQPIYVSPGHKISFETSLKIVTHFCKSRIPEPIKEAHKLCNQIKKKL